MLKLTVIHAMLTHHYYIQDVAGKNIRKILEMPTSFIQFTKWQLAGLIENVQVLEVYIHTYAFMYI